MLFSHSTNRHFAITGRLVLSYLGVALLHALWDSMHNIALILTLLFTEGEHYQSTPNGWLVEPSATQVRLLPILEWGGMAAISALAIVWLLILWRRPERPYRVAWQVPIRANPTA